MKPQTKTQSGFTMIELMIVIAIIAIIAATALPLYFDYIVKTQVNRSYYELSAAKTVIEAILSEGNKPTTERAKDSTPDSDGIVFEYIGLDKDTSNLIRTDITVTDPFESITATFNKKSAKSIYGANITLYRDVKTGVWSCVIDGSKAKAWKARYTPHGCTTAPQQP